MTWDIKAQLMGKSAVFSILSELLSIYRRFVPLASFEAAAHILSSFPEIPLTTEEYITQTTVLQNLRWPTVRPMPGAQRLVQHLHAHGVPIALATSSTREKFVTKTSHLQDAFFACFGNRVVCGDDYLGTMRGKPAPDIFLMAAQEKLGLGVGSCSGACTDEEMEVRNKVLVFEDAILGFQAAKRANMSGGSLLCMKLGYYFLTFT
jgi:pseudouridine 5'-phosphatase